MGEPHTDPQLSRVLALTNWKGGVGKTTIAKELAAHLAAQGRVLLVDLDLSGNAAVDLGMHGHPEADDGKNLADAILGGADMHPVSGVRPGLDWIPGGMALRRLARREPDEIVRAFRSKLGETADSYDLVLLDLPPSNPDLVEMALGAARYLLVPVTTDPASWDGVRMIGPYAKKAREVNPELTWLGLVLFGVDLTATRVLADTITALEKIQLPLFNTRIRRSARAAHDTRMKGQLLEEYAAGERAGVSNRDVFQALRARRTDPSVLVPRRSDPKAAQSLAEDYARLSDEVVDKIAQYEVER